MSCLLLALVLGAPSISVRVEGAATEVVAWRDRAEAGRATVANGAATLELPPGEYSLMARGTATASDVVHSLRPNESAAGTDVVLRTRPGHLLRVKSDDGARLFWQGVPLPLETVLPAGLHSIVVDHPQQVSSARRLVRLSGPLEIEVPLERGLLIRGRVLVPGEDGPRPLRGARVEVFADGLARGRVATTDWRGGFAVTGFRGVVVSLSVRAAGYGERLLRVPFYPGQERAEAEVTLKPGSAVRVQASTRARFLLLPAWFDRALGDPRARPNTAPEEAHGRTALFRSLVPGCRYRILVSAPGHLPVRSDEFVAPPAGKTATVEPLALSRGARIAGQAGAPGRVVVCRGSFGLRRCRSDRAGRYEFEGLDAGRYVLFIADADELAREVVVRAGEQRVRDLKVQAGTAAISGTVFAADGKPLAGVVVSTAGIDTVSAKDGTFQLAPLPRGRLRFAVSARPGPDCRGLTEDPHLPLREAKVRSGPGLHLRLARAGVLRVAFETEGIPLARARIRLAGASGLRITRVLPRAARSLVVPDLPVGPYAIDVTGPGLFGVRETVVQARPPKAGAAPPPADKVVVWGGRTAAGKVVLRSLVLRPGAAPPQIVDRPPPRGRVVLLDPKAERVFAFTPLDGTDGDFLLDGLPPRPVVLAIDCPGFPIAWHPVDLSEGDVRDLVLVVRQGAELAVQVLGDGDRPLPEAQVRFATEHGLDVRDLFSWVRFRGYLAADGEGDEWARLTIRKKNARFSLPEVHPGSYKAAVRAEGYKQLSVGVRARVPLVKGQIARLQPGLPSDWVSPIRLTREEPAGEDGADPGGTGKNKKKIPPDDRRGD